VNKLIERSQRNWVNYGDKYQATGAVNMIEFNGKVSQEQTFVQNIHYIGQGNGNNFLLHSNLHITVNPDGTVTASVDNFSTECN
jgi:aminoglycoside N3'-acetyltransferase